MNVVANLLYKDDLFYKNVFFPPHVCIQLSRESLTYWGGFFFEVVLTNCAM